MQYCECPCRALQAQTLLSSMVHHGAHHLNFHTSVSECTREVASVRASCELPGIDNLFDLLTQLYKDGSTRRHGDAFPVPAFVFRYINVGSVH